MAKYIKTEQGYQKIETIVAPMVGEKMDKINPTGTGSFSLNRKANTTIGVRSFAEGDNTTASGRYSHAEGSDTTASGTRSHAEGQSTTASGAHSHAEGNYTTASGQSSHAEGFFTKASGVNQHAQGKYNIEDSAGTYADIIGNGTSSKRSNAATVDWSGNAWYAGDVYVGSTSGTNKDAGSKKLATEEYVSTELGNYTPDPSLGITNATVGQIAKITAVDSNGKPTAWEPVDLPSGGGEEKWEFINYVKLTEDSGLVVFDKDSAGNSFCLKGVAVAIYSVAASTNTQNSFLKIKLNNQLAMDNQTGIRAAGNSARGCIFVDDEITKNIKTKASMMYGADSFNPIKNGAFNNEHQYGDYGGLNGSVYRRELQSGITKIDVTSALPDTQILGVDSEILIWGVRM